MADALRRLDEWSRAQREQMAYEIRPLASSMVDIEEPRPSGRGLVLAGVLAGVALTLGSLGYYVVQRTRAADEAARAAAERATEVIEAENERRLREADRQFWAAQADAGVGPVESVEARSAAGVRPPSGRPRASAQPSGLRPPL
jgi:uncharacterized protein HemX